METLLHSEILKKYKEETNEYIKKKNVEKLFDIILKNVLINKPDNIYLYIYNNIYSFLLNKIFIIGPPILKITSLLSSHISEFFNYYHISVPVLIEQYKLNKGESLNNKIIVNDEIISSILKENINNLDSKKKRGYIVEGYPNNNLQAYSCLKYLPSHVFVLYADEEYIYKKYEEENDITIFSNTQKKDYDINEPYEIKDINVKPLKDQVLSYIRNISDVLTILGTNKTVLKLQDFNDQMLIDHVKNEVSKNKDEWDSTLNDDIN
ncbi:adenylate kinase-like protein 2 [Plasmodium sp. gorilla clade G3]|nr:adenylate kinase-like protein 2 [Plasmodium sp. gorilla clade G3]